jgi:type IV pilus assembly protein PilF
VKSVTTKNLILNTTLIVGVVGMLLSGCVTSTTGGFTEAASPDIVLERRVELARNYIGEGDWSNAKRNLNLAANIDPDNAEVHEAFALVYQSTGEYELAEDSFKKAIKSRKDFSRARNNYAAFLFMQSRFEEAQTQLEYVVKDSFYTARPQAFINLGLSRLQLADPVGAEKAFVRSLSMDRSNSIALFETAQLRYEASDFSASERYYRAYRSSVRQQSSRGLWLGVRLAKISGDRDAEGSYSMALSSRYPDSAEYQAFKQSSKND